ncbi:hypothetical protein J6590_014088 [Homalodisca vitripennis]|nr:hypothetical protein J6590_014088 [Homalodisca vitripennis]
MLYEYIQLSVLVIAIRLVIYTTLGSFSGTDDILVEHFILNTFYANRAFECNQRQRDWQSNNSMLHQNYSQANNYRVNLENITTASEMFINAAQRQISLPFGTSLVLTENHEEGQVEEDNMGPILGKRLDNSPVQNGFDS